MKRAPVLLALLALVAISLWAALPARAQVAVAPTALFLSDQERFGAVYVANQSTAPQEVTVAFRFGYPDADSLGNVFMQYDDSTTAARFSIASDIRAFPQRFILPPGETQIVRLTVRPPGNASDGMYWTRILTTSTPQVPFQDTTTTGIQTRVLFRLQQVTALFYKKGNPSAQLAIESLAVEPDSQAVHVLARLHHTGDAPYLGSAIVRIYDEGGDLVQEKQESIAAYVSSLRRFSLAWPEATPGNYIAEITLTPQRTDIPPTQLLRVDPVTEKTSFVVK